MSPVAIEELKQFSNGLKQKFNLEPVTEELEDNIFRGQHSDRRLELMLELDPDNPQLEVKLLLNNQKGYLDLFMEWEEGDEDEEYEFEEEAVEEDDEIEILDEVKDPDFDKITRNLGESLYLCDHQRNLNNQLKVLQSMPEGFLKGVADFMEKYLISNITFDWQFAVITFDEDLDEIMSADGVAQMLTDAQQVLRHLE